MQSNDSSVFSKQFIQCNGHIEFVQRKCNLQIAVFFYSFTIHIVHFLCLCYFNKIYQTYPQQLFVNSDKLLYWVSNKSFWLRQEEHPAITSLIRKEKRFCCALPTSKETFLPSQRKTLHRFLLEINFVKLKLVSLHFQVKKNWRKKTVNLQGCEYGI